MPSMAYALFDAAKKVGQLGWGEEEKWALIWVGAGFANIKKR